MALALTQTALDKWTEYNQSTISFEEEILYSCLLSKGTYAEIRLLLKPEHFYLEKHQILWKCCESLYLEKQPIDLVTVVEKLKQKEEFHGIGGLDGINQLITGKIGCDHAKETYCQKVWDRWWVREFIHLSTELQSLCFTTQPDELRSQISEKFSQHLALKPSESSERMVLVSTAIEELINNTDEESIASKETGIPLLDEHYPLWGEGVLTAFLARPNMGKTQVLTWLFCQHLRRNKKPALFLSLEMTREKMSARFVANSTQIPISVIEKKKMTESQWELFWEHYQNFLDCTGYIDDTPGGEVSVGYIGLQIDKIIRQTGEAPTIFLDYAQLMGGEGEEVSRLIEISRGLKCLAQKYRIPIIFALQLNRNCESRNDKRPQLSDISYGDKFSHDLDGAFGLYGDWYYDTSKPQNEMEWINLKNRHGKRGFTLKFSYNPAINQFLPLDSSQFYDDF